MVAREQANRPMDASDPTPRDSPGAWLVSRIIGPRNGNDLMRGDHSTYNFLRRPREGPSAVVKGTRRIVEMTPHTEIGVPARTRFRFSPLLLRVSLHLAASACEVPRVRGAGVHGVVTSVSCRHDRRTGFMTSGLPRKSGRSSCWLIMVSDTAQRSIRLEYFYSQISAVGRQR